MLKIVIDNKIPFIKGVLESFAQVIYLDGHLFSHEKVKDADALIIRTRTICNKELLENSKVKFIATATIGFDHIDTQWCAEHNIFWTNAEGCNSSSVQQYFAGALLYLAENLKFELSDKTIGIVGVGNVGKKVEKIARSFTSNVLLCDPPRSKYEKDNSFVGFTDLLAHSDIITFHVPLNYSGDDKTYHMLNAQMVKYLKPNALLINSSRGEVIDTQFLKSAIKNKHLAGVVLDVWEQEPLIDFELLNLCSLATPHIAGYSADGKANGTAMSVKALCRFFGFPLINWYPENIPIPENSVISIDNRYLSFQETFSKIVQHTYSIKQDDLRFREKPEEFEKQRGNYPIRREFSAYSIHLMRRDVELENILINWRFNISENS